VWDAASGRELALLKGHEGEVTFAAFSSDGTRVVTTSRDTTARVWDAASGRELALLKGHEAEVWRAAFSADGTRVVTASHDKTARVWDVASGRELALLKGHEDEVSSAAFSADGSRVVTASRDTTARVWTVKWSTLSDSPRLLAEVCNRKLVGATARLTAGDIEKAHFLRGREGEDVCAGLRQRD
jgi:WD40 repeat protein